MLCFLNPFAAVVVVVLSVAVVVVAVVLLGVVVVFVWLVVAVVLFQRWSSCDRVMYYQVSWGPRWRTCT